MNMLPVATPGPSTTVTAGVFTGTGRDSDSEFSLIIISLSSLFGVPMLACLRGSRLEPSTELNYVVA